MLLVGTSSAGYVLFWMLSSALTHIQATSAKTEGNYDFEVKFSRTEHLKQNLFHRRILINVVNIPIERLSLMYVKVLRSTSSSVKYFKIKCNKDHLKDVFIWNKICMQTLGRNWRSNLVPNSVATALYHPPNRSSWDTKSKWALRCFFLPQ